MCEFVDRFDAELLMEWEWSLQSLDKFCSRFFVLEFVDLVTAAFAQTFRRTERVQPHKHIKELLTLPVSGRPS